MPTTNTVLNPAESFPKISPANAPANRILAKSANVFDNTLRRPSVSIGLATTSNIPQIPDGISALAAAGLEEVRVMTVEELLEWANVFPPVVPAGRGYAVLVSKKGGESRLQGTTLHLYASDQVTRLVEEFLRTRFPDVFSQVIVHPIPKDDPAAANSLVGQATQWVREGTPAMIALHPQGMAGIRLPENHAPAFLIDPGTWEKVDQKALAATLVRQDKLLGLLLDLSSGSIGTVRFDDGREYYVLFASA